MSMGCVQWLSAALVTKLMASLVAGGGMLYPRESESRIIHSLDGIWAFRLANESDSSVGHREGWYKQELRKVSVLLCLYSPHLLYFFVYMYIRELACTYPYTCVWIFSPFIFVILFLSASSSLSPFSCFILFPFIFFLFFALYLLL
jgi:hypothetical protein